MVCLRVVLHETPINTLFLCPIKKPLTGLDPATASIQINVATCKLLVAVFRDAKRTKNQSQEIQTKGDLYPYTKFLTHAKLVLFNVFQTECVVQLTYKLHIKCNRNLF